MKTTRKVILSGVLALLLVAVLCFGGCGFLFDGCSDDPEDDNNTEPGVVYTIQYTDNTGSHTIEVEDGQLYSLETLPEKTGYDFIGLFDAEVGGTQYVSANGSALAPFTDKCNMVLFPQFAAKEYTLVLDYGGADVTGQRQMNVKYGESLPELPKNLFVEHREFTGWYTRENSGGTQVADEFGLIPVVSVINETNFNLDTEYIYLYAGFDAEMLDVTFSYGGSMQEDRMEVAYGTDISDIVTDKRNADGHAVLTWSTSLDGSRPFTGSITNDMVLYAAEWAPVIELDLSGGDYIAPIVAKAGASVTLPVPTRENYKFMRWETNDGEEAYITEMPADGAKLKAVWQAMLVFDENGGTEVADISQETGTPITLPVPEKEGYIFAGWYTEDKEKYEAPSMPSAGIALKAGWYRVKTKTWILIKDSNNEDDWAYSARMYSSSTEASGPQADWRREIDLADYVPSNGANIKVSVHYDMKINESTSIFDGGFYLYDNTTVSDANFLMKHTDSVSSTSWKSFSFTADLSIRTNRLFFCYYAKKTNSDKVYSRLYFKNFYVDLTYPDTSNLYL